MILFPSFAILVWWAVAVFRRRWQSFVILVVAVTILALIGAFHAYLGRITDYSLFVPVFQSIWIPYVMLVGAIGLLIACMPRRFSGAVCPACGYPDEGLQATMLCPECGTKRVNATVGDSCAICSCDLAELPRRGECPDCEGLYLKPPRTQPRSGADWFSGARGGISYENGGLDQPANPGRSEVSPSYEVSSPDVDRESLADNAQDDPDEQDSHRHAGDEQPADRAASVG